MLKQQEVKEKKDAEDYVIITDPPVCATATWLDMRNAITGKDVLPELVMLTMEDLQGLTVAQRGDPKIQPFIDYLKVQLISEEDHKAHRMLREADQFELVDGTLYRRIPSA